MLSLSAFVGQSVAFNLKYHYVPPSVEQNKQYQKGLHDQTSSKIL